MAIALLSVLAVYPIHVDAKGGRASMSGLLAVRTDIEIGIASEPVKGMASSDAVDAQSLSREVVSYVGGSVGELHKAWTLDWLVRSVGDLLARAAHCIAAFVGNML